VWPNPNGAGAACEAVVSGFDFRRPPQQRTANRPGGRHRLESGGDRQRSGDRALGCPPTWKVNWPGASARWKRAGAARLADRDRRFPPHHITQPRRGKYAADIDRNRRARPGGRSIRRNCRQDRPGDIRVPRPSLTGRRRTDRPGVGPRC